MCCVSSVYCTTLQHFGTRCTSSSCHKKIPPHTGNQKQQSADKGTSDRLGKTKLWTTPDYAVRSPVLLELPTPYANIQVCYLICNVRTRDSDRFSKKLLSVVEKTVRILNQVTALSTVCVKWPDKMELQLSRISPFRYQYAKHVFRKKSVCHHRLQRGCFYMRSEFFTVLIY